MSQSITTFDSSVRHVETRDGETVDVDPNHPLLRSLRRRSVAKSLFGWTSTIIYRVELKQRIGLKEFCESFDRVFAEAFGLKKISFSFKGDRFASFHRNVVLPGQRYGVRSVEIAMSTQNAFTVTVTPKYQTGGCMFLGILGSLTIYTVITFIVFVYLATRCFNKKVSENEPLLIDQFDAGLQDMLPVDRRDIRVSAMRRLFVTQLNQAT